MPASYKIDSIPWTVIYPDFGDALTHRLDISGISILKPFDSR
jgi:hypothetical protein